MSGNPRLRLTPHLAGHVLSTRDAVLLGETERYVLRGEVYAALVPLLDGTRTADDLDELLRLRFAPGLVRYALMQLEAKGYVEPANGDSEPSLERAWWSAHGVRRNGEAGITVYLGDAGAPPSALVALTKALHRHTLLAAPAHAASGGVALIATGDYLDPQFALAVRRALPSARCVLPLRLGGATIWLGPMLHAAECERFDLLLRRIGDNRPVDAVAVERGARFPLLPPQGLPETFELAAALIASALAAIAAGSPPSGLVRGVLTLDPWTLETRCHPHPVTWLSRSAGREPALDAKSGQRAVPLEETLSRLEPFVSPITGIVPALERLPTQDGSFVYLARRLATAEPGAFRANRQLGRPSLAAGKGVSDLQAKVSCLAEAIERHSGGWVGDEPRRRGRFRELGERAIEPATLLQFSEKQYRERLERNGKGRSADWVPAPVDLEREIDWAPAWSLSTRETVWLPAAYCYFRHPGSGGQEEAMVWADSNGCAAGNTLGEAILQGTLELVERDACAIWWHNRVRRPEVDLAGFSDPFISRTLSGFEGGPRQLSALDLTTDLGIPVVAAISSLRDDGGHVQLGLGCHLDPRIAASRALSELQQNAAYDAMLGADASDGDILGSERARWLAEVNLTAQPCLRPTSAVAPPATGLAKSNSKTGLEGCIERLRQHRLEVIVLDQTRPEIGFPVARVVIPGLRHYRARFAAGRLYDVPAALGWLERPREESELNATPFFL
jgi:thiazole/oxazole-forming peptide maturase SagD family component